MMITLSVHQTFTEPLLEWFDVHGRHDLPWQQPKTPYRVWISEVMLQQTQVTTAIPYFERFINHFPHVESLAKAPLDEVLAHWSGLGYYSRARNLHKTACLLHEYFQGELPDTPEALIQLPGIGASTAAAIASLAYGKPTAILDGNVKRVLCRYFLISGLTSTSLVHQTLLNLANTCMPNHRSSDYTQAIMDLGATRCTPKNPRCQECPLQSTCLSRKNNVVHNFPNKSPKKIRPTRHEHFLLIHTNAPKIYLEQRPPKGIWGGLWCLPSIEPTQCPVQYCAESYHLSTSNPHEFMTLKHDFTHVHLQIKASCLQTLHEDPLPGLWFHPKDIPQLGLSKPVSLILKHFVNR